MIIRRRFRTFPCLILRNVVYSLLLSAFLLIYLAIWLDKRSVLNDLSPRALEFIRYKPTPEKTLQSNKVRYFINKYNEDERVSNLDKFGLLKRDTIVIVVQVNKYRDNFKYLLASLCEVKGIQDTLLIFSHSYVDDNVNKLIQSIDFCRVLQIFFPYSLQAYPHEFPGFSKNDCPYGKGIGIAEFINCTRKYYTSDYRKFRHAANAEKKHFWWWTANKVFHNLTCLESHNCLVIFLEDDLYIMQDFLYMMHYMRNVVQSFPNSEIISIRTDPSIGYDDVRRVEVSTWDPRHHSSVVALDASVWNTIVAHYDLFCSADDSSWARSLFFISLNREFNENKRLKVLYSSMARVIKTSSCSQEILRSCDPLENVLQVLTVQKKLKNALFPPYLEVYTHIELDEDEYVAVDMLEGGWNDPRDVDLCRNITLYKVMKLLVDMDTQFQEYNTNTL